MLSSVNEDLELIQACCMYEMPIINIFIELVATNNEYAEKLQSSRQNEKEMMSLVWKVKELSNSTRLEEIYSAPSMA